MAKFKVLVKDILKKLYPVKMYKADKTLQKYVYSILLPAEKIAQCDCSEEAKAKIIAEWESTHPEKAADLKEKIGKCIEKAGFPDSAAAELDMKFWFYAYGYNPSEYITYGFQSKTYEERRSYISDRESVCLGHHLNDIFALRIFMDKAKTYERFQKYFNRDCITVEKHSSYEVFCDFVQAHPIFVKKNVGESCGRSVELFDATGRDLKALFEEFGQSSKLILEERIEQSEHLAELNASSVNTVRCFTLKTRDGIVIPWTLMKIGRDGSFVDNGGAGGLLVGIDPETGVFNTDARDEYGFSFDKHPDSGITFQGFRLPEWDKMIAICKEMAELEPLVPWIGWDMTYTNQGWVVVEGNSMSEVIGPQSTMQRGIRCEFDKHLKNVALFMKNKNVYTGKRL